jgi:GNAT superfamily N-acetyltransferase
MRTPAMTIPVQELNRNHIALLKRHFNALGADDIRLRFGTPMASEQLDKYVDGIPIGKDIVFGVYSDDLALIGVAHLACWPGAGELGLSVLPQYRGLGIGSALFARAVMRARNMQIVELFMHCLAHNKGIMHIARKAGMHIVQEHAEADAYLELQPGNPLTLGREIVERQFAFYDWARKVYSGCPR